MSSEKIRPSDWQKDQIGKTMFAYEVVNSGKNSL